MLGTPDKPGLSEDDKWLLQYARRIMVSILNGNLDVLRMLLLFFGIGCIAQAADLLKVFVLMISATGTGKTTLMDMLASLFNHLCAVDAATGRIDTQTSPMIVEADFVQRQGSSGSSDHKAVTNGRARACGLGFAMARVSRANSQEAC